MKSFIPDEPVKMPPVIKAICIIVMVLAVVSLALAVFQSTILGVK